jgi:hypothetical protein
MAIAACSSLNDWVLCTSVEGDIGFFSLTPCGERPARFEEQTTHLVANHIERDFVNPIRRRPISV